MRTLEVQFACTGTIIERWTVTLPDENDNLAGDELHDAIWAALSDGDAAFVSQETMDEQDRNLTHINGVAV